MPKLSQKLGDDLKAHDALVNNTQQRSHLSGKKPTAWAQVDIGYLPDGTAIFLDPQIMRHDEDYTFNSTKDADWVIEDPKQRLSRFNLPKGIISKQEHYYPELLDGRVRGILPEEDRWRLNKGELEQLRLEKPECFIGISKENLPDFMQLVFEEGSYPKQAIAHMHVSPDTVVNEPYLMETKNLPSRGTWKTK